MTDIRADEGTPLDQDDRLPWLEAVEEEEGGDGPSLGKLLAYVVIGLAIIGAIVGGVFWLQNRNSGTEVAGGEPEMIRAPAGPYKEKPSAPGGMAVEGEGDTAFAASAGADPRGQINTDAVAETPVTQTKDQPAPAAQPAPAPAAPAAPAPTEAAPGGTIQLGAFPNGAAAEKAWKSLAGRFAYLAPLSHNVVTAEVNGRTYYRLRASGPGAQGICGRLQVAGEQCLKV
jgi:hypothetical protein